MSYQISDDERLDLSISLSFSISRMKDFLEIYDPGSAPYLYYQNQLSRFENLLNRLKELPYEKLS